VNKKKTKVIRQVKMHKTPVNKGRNEFLHFVSIEKLLNHVYIYQTVINILTIMFDNNVYNIWNIPLYDAMLLI
jgi:hypothetical protein